MSNAIHAGYDYDVVVIGGGVVGLTAAIGMRLRDYSVLVIDAALLSANLAQLDTRVYAINSASEQLLRDLGVWQGLDSSRAAPYQHMHIWEAESGAAIDFDARMIKSTHLGYILEESVLKQALLARAAAVGVVCVSQQTVHAIVPEVNQVTVSCGQRQWIARLLIVADGANSSNRERLGVSMTSWPYHQHALVTHVTTEKDHNATAYQVFHADGPLALLPLSKPNQCSIVWSTMPARVDHLMRCPDAAFNQELTKASGSILGSLSILSSRHHFPLLMRHAQQYYGSRWLLMGDAAHTIHPLAGLGLNLGLEDVASWLSMIKMSQSPPWSSKNLAAYQRQRKYAVWKIILLMEGLKTIFSNPIPLLGFVRKVGLNFCNQQLLLKKLMIQQASGVAVTRDDL